MSQSSAASNDTFIWEDVLADTLNDLAAALVRAQDLLLRLEKAAPDESSPSNVQTHNFIPAEDRWYAIIVGREPGVYRGARHVVPNTTSIPHASAQRYKSQEQAEEAFNAALDAGQVYKVVVTHNHTRTQLTRADVYGLGDGSDKVNA